eukprot:scaffold174408_cov19-Prasinocladus_malaysianus.AAC.2
MEELLADSHAEEVFRYARSLAMIFRMRMSFCILLLFADSRVPYKDTNSSVLSVSQSCLHTSNHGRRTIDSNIEIGHQISGKTEVHDLYYDT